MKPQLRQLRMRIAVCDFKPVFLSSCFQRQRVVSTGLQEEISLPGFQEQILGILFQFSESSQLLPARRLKQEGVHVGHSLKAVADLLGAASEDGNVLN